MKTRSYQIALVVAVGACLLLGAALAFELSRGHFHMRETPAEDVVVARGPDKDSKAAPANSLAQTGGEPSLAPIQISPERLQQIGVTTALVDQKNMNDTLSAPGDVEINEQKLSYVQTRFAGWIQDVSADATYQYVRKGQKLFTVYSPDLVSSEQEYLLAKGSESAFSQDMHGAAQQENGWMVQAAEERLLQFGMQADEIAELKKSNKVQRNVTVYSPVSGYITERNALPNAYVQPDMKAYTIADLSSVWVYANVAQSDIGRLKPGDPGQVTVDAYPGRKFNGRINQILPQVDQTTRTVKVRLVLGNPGVALKPGMYVNVDIDVPLGRQLVVPASAVLQAGARTIAFVDHGGGNLEPREIETGPTVDDSVVVLNGLKAGERVVSSANFLVDSEAQLQASFGGAAPSGQQQGSMGDKANAGPAQESLQIELNTDPTPPRKGANTVHVRLTGADGKSVTGVQVNVNFFMAAMPAMGMAAEHTQTTLADKGNGQYEGQVQLEAGGTWAVSVAVQRGGQTVATRKLSVSATGGM